MTKFPDLNEEALLWGQGNAFVFGVDEAGRGCLAGPVCAAVTCWAPLLDLDELPVPVRDSKQMTEAHREAVYDPIMAGALAYGIGFASAEEIDQWNILKATHLAAARAMERALAYMVNSEKMKIGQIPVGSFAFLSDGGQPLLSNARNFIFSPDFGPEFPLIQELMLGGISEKCIIKGDSKVFSIASASVLAKVTRDRHMLELDRAYPQYAFAAHKGYSTAMHVEKLRASGPCSEHRMTFAPVAEAALLNQ